MRVATIRRETIAERGGVLVVNTLVEELPSNSPTPLSSKNTTPTPKRLRAMLRELDKGVGDRDGSFLQHM